MNRRKRLLELFCILQIFFSFQNGVNGVEFEKNLLNLTNYEDDDNNKSIAYRLEFLKQEETTQLALEENIISDELEEEEENEKGKLKPNELKNDEIETPKQIPLPPDVPMNNLKVIDTTSNSITISWRVSQIFVPTYKIEWSKKSIEGGILENPQFATSNLSIFNITELESCSMYSIQITKEINDQPEEKPHDSKILVDSTKASVPGRVEELSVEAEETSLNISWKLPLKNSQCVENYEVKVLDDKGAEKIGIRTKEKFYKTDSLEPCTKYQITVVARGLEDIGSSDKNRIEQSTKSVVPGEVTNLKVETSETSAKIWWDLPKNSKCVTQYLVEIFHSENILISRKTTGNNFFDAIDLMPCTKYNFTVKSEGDNGSSTGQNATAQTKSSRLNKVKDLMTIVKINSIDISWTPLGNNECVIGYLVSVFNSSIVNEEIVYNETTKKNYFNATNLLPCVKHTIVVKALGYSESSNGTNATVITQLVKPSKPTNVSHTPIVEKALKIVWSPPEIGASCVKEYHITLKTNVSEEIYQINTTTKNEIQIDNLFPCTSYSLEINAVDIENAKSDSEFIQNTTPTLQSVAQPPRRVKAPTYTKDSATLYWKIESENNCTVEAVIVYCHYTVNEFKGIGYKPKNGTGQSSVIEIDQLKRKLVNIKVENLSPFTNYDCKATTINVAGQSDSSIPVNVMTEEDVPSAPQMNLTDVSDLEYSFEWIKPDIIPGTIQNYEIDFTWEPSFPIPDKCNTLKHNSTILDSALLNYTHQKGSPYSQYEVRIRAKTRAGYGNYSESISFMSDAGVPSKVTNFTYKHEGSKNDANVLSTILQWGLPCELNGVIEFFNISVHGVRNETVHNFTKILETGKDVHKDDIFMVDLEELRPSYYYTFILTTKVRNVTELGAGTTYYTNYPAGIPVQPDVEYVKMLTIDPQKAIKTTTSATVLLPLFPATNGDIKYYAVMVSTRGNNKGTRTRYELKGNEWPNSSCWQESMLKDFSIPYQATSPEWNPFPNNVVDYGHIKAVKFVLGQDTDCQELSINTNRRLYCNGPLKPGTFYDVRMRAFTEGGYSDSDVFIVKTNAEINIPIIIGIVIGIMVLGILTTMMLLVRKCSPHAVLRRFLHSDLPGSPVPTPFTRRKFISHCQQLADNPGKLSCEFQLLQTLSLDLQMPTNAACLQANRKKNRYSDILPYDFSRVKLDVIDNDPNTDYINASFITGYSGEDEYIACQGPKEETTYDFWRMIDQYDVKIIIMLTQLFEKGKEKCHQYFPTIRETFTYEKMSIRCTSELDYRTCTQRTLVLQKDEQKRSIMHLHFKDWPDHDVPEDFDPMINFCQIMRRHITANKGLVVIHCSAGIGRTGTLITIDMLLQSMRENRKLDVFGTVYRLRRHRLNMVQRESQYAYIYNCVRQVLKNPYILKNYKPPPMDLHKNSKKKKDSANSSLGLVSSLDWRKDSISLSADSMEPMYQSSPSSTLETPTRNGNFIEGLRCSKSLTALDPKILDTRVVKTCSQGYVTYESIKNSSFGSSNASLTASDTQGSRKSIYENVRPLFRSKSDQLLDVNDVFLCGANYSEAKEEDLEEKDTSL